MELQTKIEIRHAKTEIVYQERLLLLGSCFSEHIAQKLQESCFQVSSNPFGVLYNPISIARCLSLLLQNGQDMVEAEDTVQYNGMWHSLLHHGSFSCADKQAFEKGISESITAGRKALREADVVIVTFGTAWVYEKNGRIVSNCHKLPANQFSRRRMSAEEIVEIWSPLTAQLTRAGKRVIFTISPIRHLKDGLHENQLSKAVLLLATEQLVHSDQVEYFPSYELMMDELRDYRYYADDMLHPSTMAVEYIWERFCHTYFSAETQSDMRVLQQLYKDFSHRPLHADTTEWRAFIKKRQERLEALQQQYPWLIRQTGVADCLR